jgi:uncharacterized protein with LGFP repeats
VSRRTAPRAVVLVLVSLALLLPVLGSAPADRAAAADARQFQPGNIISDDLFYDGRAMTAPEVQAFLDQKGAACRTGADGTPCLKVYRQDTEDKAADQYCQGYRAAWQESAADIIAKVGQSCGISQRVLMVILQKEQSLVTNTGSSLYARRYREAMGFACPDTAPCNPAYNGFFNQVYSGARQYRVYQLNATRYAHRAGTTVNVRFHPDAACGSSPVYIQNQATAGLYNYTPYQPNAAALAAGYKVGDGCSAYGNRNFWLYYTDWFGTTQSPGGGEVARRYAALGGEGGVLGAPRSAIGCGLRDGGCFQDYAYGAIHWSPATGARVTRGWIADRWWTAGREGGELGYPTSDEQPTPRGDGVYQTFQRGSVYVSPAGARVVKGWVFDRWTALGREQSVLGFPTSEETGVAGGVTQSFQRGVISSSAGTGAHAVWGWVLDEWAALGREGGVLGFPTSDEVATAAGAYNTFAGGAVYSTAQTGAHAVVGWIGQRWIAAGAGSAAVGYPVEDEQRAPDGVGAYSEFSNGLIVSSARTGAHDLVGPVAAKWTALGGVRSFLGYPTADPKAVAGGSVSAFQGGSVYRAPGAAQAFEVHGWIAEKWAAAGGPGGALGWPTSDERPAGDGTGVLQDYTGGVVYSSVRTGARVVLGPIAAKWAQLGGAAAWIGAPVSDQLGMPDRRGAASVFASGAAVYWSPTTGAFEVHGWIRQLYSSLNGEQSFLGYPTSDETPVPGTQAVVGSFQGGRIYSSAVTGAHEVHGAILDTYLAQGGPAGALGLPTSNEYAVPEGRASDFEHGRIVCNTTTGTLTVTPR